MFTTTRRLDKQTTTEYSVKLPVDLGVSMSLLNKSSCNAVGNQLERHENRADETNIINNKVNPALPCKFYAMRINSTNV
jgi:hypothetical protein